MNQEYFISRLYENRSIIAFANRDYNKIKVFRKKILWVDFYSFSPVCQPRVDLPCICLLSSQYNCMTGSICSLARPLHHQTSHTVEDFSILRYYVRHICQRARTHMPESTCPNQVIDQLIYPFIYLVLDASFDAVFDGQSFVAPALSHPGQALRG